MRVAACAWLVVVAACGDNLEPSAWRSGPALPGGRLEASVVAVDDALWVVGGFDDELRIVDDVWILEPGAEAWRAGPAAPLALTHAGLAVVDGTLYLLGGLVGTDFAPSARAWALDAGGEAWREVASMPEDEARGAAAVIVDGGRIVLAGGAGADAALASVIAYDPAADAWTNLPALPEPRSHPVGARAPDGAVIVVGGLATLDARSARATVLALAPDGDAWTERAAMPTARGGCAAAVIGEALICAGGEAGAAALAVAEAYDLAADAWTTLSPMRQPRAGTHGAAIVTDGGAALWVPGGAHALRYEPIASVTVLEVP